jgi:hypothetical protein
MLDYYTVDGAAISGNSFTLSKDVTVSAVFRTIPVESTEISINFIRPQDDLFLTGGNSMAKPDGTLTVTVQDGSVFTGYTWIIDGSPLSGTNSSVILNAGDYAVGMHRLTVWAYKAGVPYSRELMFRVTN